MPLLPSRLRGLTGWAKATAVSAAALLISLGLCGINYGVFAALNPSLNGTTVPGHEAQQRWADTIITTALIESVAIVVCALALFVSLVGLLVTTAVNRRTRSR